MRDIKVYAGKTTLPYSSSDGNTVDVAVTLDGGTSAIDTSAFVKLNHNNNYVLPVRSDGDFLPDAGGCAPCDMSCWVELIDVGGQPTVRFHYDAGTSTFNGDDTENDKVACWEVWEYVGLAGGANEFKVDKVLTFEHVYGYSWVNTTGGPTMAPGDGADTIVFRRGVSWETSKTNGDPAGAENDCFSYGSGFARAFTFYGLVFIQSQIGPASAHATETSTLYYTNVHFTGSNWSGNFQLLGSAYSAIPTPGTKQVTGFSGGFFTHNWNSTFFYEQKNSTTNRGVDSTVTVWPYDNIYGYYYLYNEGADSTRGSGNTSLVNTMVNSADDIFVWHATHGEPTSIPLTSTNIDQQGSMIPQSYPGSGDASDTDVSLIGSLMSDERQGTLVDDMATLITGTLDYDVSTTGGNDSGSENLGVSLFQTTQTGVNLDFTYDASGTDLYWRFSTQIISFCYNVKQFGLSYETAYLWYPFAYRAEWDEYLAAFVPVTYNSSDTTMVRSQYNGTGCVFTRIVGLGGSMLMVPYNWTATSAFSAPSLDDAPIMAVGVQVPEDSPYGLTEAARPVGGISLSVKPSAGSPLTLNYDDAVYPETVTTGTWAPGYSEVLIYDMSDSPSWTGTGTQLDMMLHFGTNSWTIGGKFAVFTMWASGHADLGTAGLTGGTNPGIRIDTPVPARRKRGFSSDGDIDIDETAAAQRARNAEQIGNVIFDETAAAQRARNADADSTVEIDETAAAQRSRNAVSDAEIVIDETANATARRNADADSTVEIDETANATARRGAEADSTVEIDETSDGTARRNAEADSTVEIDETASAQRARNADADSTVEIDETAAAQRARNADADSTVEIDYAVDGHRSRNAASDGNVVIEQDTVANASFGGEADPSIEVLDTGVNPDGTRTGAFLSRILHAGATSDVSVEAVTSLATAVRSASVSGTASIVVTPAIAQVLTNGVASGTISLNLTSQGVVLEGPEVIYIDQLVGCRITVDEMSAKSLLAEAMIAFKPGDTSISADYSSSDTMDALLDTTVSANGLWKVSVPKVTPLTAVRITDNTMTATLVASETITAAQPPSETMTGEAANTTTVDVVRSTDFDVEVMAGRYFINDYDD